MIVRRQKRGRPLAIVSRVGVLLIAGMGLSSLTAFAVAAVTSGPASGSLASTGSDQVSFLKTLAGPVEAPIYPSGLIWDQTFPGSADGAIVVADTGYNRISVYDPTSCPNPDTSTCAPLEPSFGTYGSANGQFNTPRDVAVDASSNIYVADAANNRIQAFTSTGQWLWTAGEASATCSSACLLDTPIGISYDPTTNEVLVADTGHSEIKAFAAVGGAYGFAAGTYMWESPKGIIKSPREARRGPDGEIWVADYNDERVVAFQCTCTSSSTAAPTPWNSTPNKVLGDGLKGGHKPGELNSPYNIAFSPNGQIGYVADTGNERIAVFDVDSCNGTTSNGVADECTFVADYGARCPDPCPAPPGNAGYFVAIRRVTVDAAGNIWAADFWGSGIHEFTPSGQTYPAADTTEIDGSPAPASGFAEAYGVGIGPDGTTYVADRLNQRIEEFAANGTYVTDEGSRGVAPGQYSWPEAVAVTPDKTVWVGDTRNGRLEHFTNADLTGTPAIVGSKGAGLGEFNYIEGVSAAANGVVWVADTDNNRVQSYNPATQTFEAFGTKGSAPDTNQLLAPESVVASATDMYIADTGNNRIVELDLNGNYVASYTGLDAPQGIALAPDGSLWVANTGTAQTDTNGNDIVHLSSSLTLLGGGFGGPGGGNLQFFEPHSLAVTPDGTTLFVADTYNNRVQEFSIASQLDFTTSPSGGAPGATLATQPVVAVQNEQGGVVAADNGSSVTIGLTGSPSATLSCTDAGGLTVPVVNGVATFSGCSVNNAGTYTLTATDGTLPSSTSASFLIGSVGPAAQLAFTTQPGGAAAGAVLTPEPVVTVEDSNGNTVTTDASTVTLAITSGTGTSGAALTCTGGESTAAVNGVASFSGCTVNDVGSGYTLTATDGTLTPAVSSGFNVATAVGPPSKLAFNGTPGGAAPGALLSPQPTVNVEDANNNTVTTDTSTVTLAITSGAGTSGAVLSCTGGLSLAAVNGVASFSGCTINLAGTGYTLTATDAGDSLPHPMTTSHGFNIASGPPAQLAFTTSPGGAAPGAALNPQPVVTVEDSSGNTVTTDTSSVTLEITPGTGASGANLACTNAGDLTVQAVDGVATFSGCSIDTSGSGYTLTATDTGDSPAPSPATSASFSVFGFSPVYSGEIYSPEGAASIYPDGGTVDANGNVYITDSGNSQILEQPKVSTASPSFGVAVGPGASAQLAFTTMPVNAAPSAAFASQPVVAVEDVNGDTVTTDDSSVTLALTPGTGTSGANLVCTDTGDLTVQAVNGVATFSGCSVDTAGTGYTLTATDSTLTAAVSSGFSITTTSAGPATQVAFTSSPGGAAPGAAFASQPVVYVEDAGGNTVTTDTSTVTLSITTGTGTSGAGLTCTGGLSTAAVNGVATFSGCAIDTAGTGYTLTAIDSSYGALRVIVPPSFGLNHPRGLQLDPGGQDIWVPDTENNRLVEFTLSGTYVTTLGSASVSGGNLRSPYGVVFSGGNAYVADTYGYNVVAFQVSTKKVLWTTSTCEGKALTRTRGIGLGPDGNLYVTDTDNDRIVVLNTSGTCIGAFGTGGHGNTAPGDAVQFSAPRDVISDGSDGLWVTDAGNYRLDHLTLTGTVISTTTGGYGSGPGQFVSPQTLFANGALIDVSDTYDYDIEEFSVSAGAPVYVDRIAQGTPPADPGFNGAWSVAYGPSGELYATDWFNHRVEKFNPDGTFAFSFGSYGSNKGQLEYPRGIAVSPDGTYVAVAQENNNIEFFNSNGTYLTEFAPAGGLHRPRQVVIAPDGTVWVADYGHNRVLHLSGINTPADGPPGTIILSITDGSGGAALSDPQGVVLDDAGHVFVSDSANNEVDEYDTDGTFIAQITTPGTGSTQTTFPAELAVIGPAGGQVLLIADSGNNRVLAVNIDGPTVTPDLSFGSAGSGPGEFDQPDSVAYDPTTGEVAVADFINNRVSLWTTEGS